MHIVKQQSPTPEKAISARNIIDFAGTYKFTMAKPFRDFYNTELRTNDKRGMVGTQHYAFAKLLVVLVTRTMETYQVKEPDKFRSALSGEMNALPCDTNRQQIITMMGIPICKNTVTNWLNKLRAVGFILRTTFRFVLEV